MATTQSRPFTAANRADRQASLTRIGLRVLLYGLLIVLSIIALAPFFFTFSGSLMAPGEIFSLSPHFVPQELVWKNYSDLFQRFPFLTYMRNSAVISVLNTVCVLFFSSLIGYVFAKRRFPGRDAL